MHNNKSAYSASLYVDGDWTVACDGELTADPSETCNGEDDDCDGITDEMLSRSCGTSSSFETTV